MVSLVEHLLLSLFFCWCLEYREPFLMLCHCGLSLPSTCTPQVCSLGEGYFWCFQKVNLGHRFIIIDFIHAFLRICRRVYLTEKDIPIPSSDVQEKFLGVKIIFEVCLPRKLWKGDIANPQSCKPKRLFWCLKKQNQNQSRAPVQSWLTMSGKYKD